MFHTCPAICLYTFSWRLCCCSALCSPDAKYNPAALYRTGYDKALTAQRWAAGSPGDAVVIIGGYHSVWQKANEPAMRSNRGSASRSTEPMAMTWRWSRRTLSVADHCFAHRELRRVRRVQGLGAASGAVIELRRWSGREAVYVGVLTRKF